MSCGASYRDIVDFLVKPENIESALDLAEVMPRVRDRLHVKFWKTLKEAVERGLRKQGITDWTPQLLGDTDVVEPEDFLKGRWGALELKWSGVDDKMPLYWAYWVEQDYRTEKGAAPLRYGLGFWSEDEQRIKRLATKLPGWAKELYDHPSRWKSAKNPLSSGWLVYAEPGRLRDRSETIRLARVDELESEIASALLELFDKTHKDAEAEMKNRSPT